MNTIEIPLSISECAKMFGLSDKTVRRAIKNGELPYITVKERYRILFKDMLKWSHIRPRLEHSRDQKGIGQFVARWHEDEMHIKKTPDRKSVDGQRNFFEQEQKKLV